MASFLSEKSKFSLNDESFNFFLQKWHLILCICNVLFDFVKDTTCIPWLPKYNAENNYLKGKMCLKINENKIFYN